MDNPNKTINRVLKTTESSIIYDNFGYSFKIKDLNKFDFENKDFFTHSLNEKTLKLEKKRIFSVNKLKKEEIIKIKVCSDYLELTSDSNVMVNRNGIVIWVQAKDILKNDLLVIPKKMFSDKKQINIRSLFPRQKGPNFSCKSGKEKHSADVSLTLDKLMYLAVICGMLDAKGSFDLSTGEIFFSSKDKTPCFVFASTLCEVFLTEPSIEVNENLTSVKLTNKIVTKVINEFLNNLGSQNQEIISFYLSGYFHADPSWGFMDGFAISESNDSKKGKPFISLPLNSDIIFDRLKKSLFSFGIVPFRSGSSCFIFDSYFIETFLLVTPIVVQSYSHQIDNFLEKVINEEPTVNEILGYHFGKEIEVLKTHFGFIESKYNDVSIFKNTNKNMHYSIAHFINSFLKQRFPKDFKCAINSLVESDIWGAKVISIEKLDKIQTYEIISDSGNVFVNGILCQTEKR